MTTVTNNSNETGQFQESSAADFEQFLQSDEKGSEMEQPETSPVDETPEVEEEEELDRTSDDSEDDTDEPDNEEVTEGLEDGEEEETQKSSAPFDDDSEVVLNINGEDVTVKGNELKAGYLRQADYTRKTQELGTTRKELEKERSNVAEHAKAISFHSIEKMKQFDQAIQQEGGWAQMKTKYSPEEVEKFTHMYVQAQNEAKVAQGILDDYSKRTVDSNKAVIHDVFKEMANTIPNFNGNTVSEMEKYAVSAGIEPEALLHITEPAYWRMMHSAMLWDQAQAKRSKEVTQASKAKTQAKVQSKSKSVPGKQMPVSTTSRKVDKAIKSMKNTSGGANQRAAIHAFEAFLR